MTPTPDTPARTPEEVVTDALVMTDLSDYAGTDMGMIGQATGSVLRALRAAGLLVAAPTEEQIERAAKALFEDPAIPGEYTWAEMVAEDPSRAELWRADARRILTTAAGVAPQEKHLSNAEILERIAERESEAAGAPVPQEPSECSNPRCPLRRAHSGPCAPEGWSPGREKLIADLWEEAQFVKVHSTHAYELMTDAAAALAAVPSVDEDALAEVIEASAAEWGDSARVQSVLAQYIARAVVEWMEKQR